MAEQHARPAVERGPGRLGDQRGLAETCLTRDEHHLAASARGDALERVQQRRQLERSRPTTPAVGRERARRPGNGTDGPVTAPPSGSHRTSTVSTGSGKPFRVIGPDARQLVPAAAASHQPHDVGRQHLSALATGAQPRRLDDRIAEVVVVLSS